MKINDLALLKEIVAMGSLKDIRATWIGDAEYPSTDVKNELFQRKCTWQIQHWMMYEGYLRFVTKPSGNMIDVGCGGGYPSARLAYLYPDFNVTGIDLVKEAIAFARKYNNKRGNVKFKTHDILTYPTDVKYDYVFALEVMEHMYAQYHWQFVDKVLSLCKPDGLVFLTTPNLLGAPDTHFGHKGHLNTQRARKFYNKYRDRIIHLAFYDNAFLHTKDHSAFTVNEPFEKYTDKTRNKSHFQIVMK
jgi:2-polyprenyl-3-methyl-5-hydroxy-6-metoxy-1,4-benzoquinol methylase